MRIFVDFVDPSGTVTSSREPSTVDGSMPLEILTAAIFLDASRQGDPVAGLRVFHVEGGRFVEEDDLDGAGIGELDTLMVVNTDDHRFHVREALASLWVRRGGSTRRVAHMPVMPMPQLGDWGSEITTLH